MSLRRRVAFALWGLVTLFVLAISTLAWVSVEEQEDNLVDSIVQSEAHRLGAMAARGELQHAEADELEAPGPGLSAWLVEPDGRAVPGPLPSRLQALPPGVHRLGRPDQHLHVAVEATPVGRLVLQYDAERHEAKVHEFGLQIAGLALLCVTLAALMADRLAVAVMAPLERLARDMEAWAPDGETGTPPPADKESRLRAAFGRVQARLEATLTHEREHLANLGHEIRTPLAALRTDLEMLRLQPAAGDTARIDRALQAADAIAGALDSARNLRARAPAHPAFTRLAGCVDDAWASLGELPARVGLSLANELPADAHAWVDRHALLTILRNLLRNAAEHAAPAHCLIQGDAFRVMVSDDGPGIAPEDLPRIFERYHRGPRRDAPEQSGDDRGLGLAIALQMAELNGWRLEAESLPVRGCRFTLWLAPAP